MLTKTKISTKEVPFDKLVKALLSVPPKKKNKKQDKQKKDKPKSFKKK